ncbi:MAG: TIGR01906 family membrane protein [Actinomycetota bacterium]|nr:TIGR01906 family membrane protein [Actinomycetota bacterium]
MTALARWLVIVLLPVFLLLTNVRLVMSHTYVHWEYSKQDFPPAATISPAERLSTALASLDFVRGQLSETEFRALEVDGQPAFNEREVRHMLDVRNVAARASLVHILAGTLLTAALLLLALRGRWAARALVAGSLTTVVSLLLIGLLAALSFDRFFALFHRLFFEGDSWIFEYNDTLIQLFPLPFWSDATLLITSATLTEALLIGGLAGWRVQAASADDKPAL